MGSHTYAHCKTIEIEKENEREKHVNSFSRFELFERGLIVCMCIEFEMHRPLEIRNGERHPKNNE